MDKIIFIRQLKATIPDVAFLELQNKSDNTSVVDVNNICFVKNGYFIILWGIDTIESKIEVCKIPDKNIKEFETLRYSFQLINNVEKINLFTFFDSKNGKELYINYFTVMVCLIMPYVEFKFDFKVANYQIDKNNIPQDDPLLVNLINEIQVAYEFANNNTPL